MKIFNYSIFGKIIFPSKWKVNEYSLMFTLNADNFMNNIELKTPNNIVSKNLYLINHRQSNERYKKREWKSLAYFWQDNWLLANFFKIRSNVNMNHNRKYYNIEVTIAYRLQVGIRKLLININNVSVQLSYKIYAF